MQKKEKEEHMPKKLVQIVEMLILLVTLVDLVKDVFNLV